MKSARISLIGIWLAVLVWCPPVRAEFLLSSTGKAECVLVQQAGATAPEQHALQELKLHLDQITGGNFSIVTNDPPASARAIIVGPGDLAAKYFPEIDLGTVGPEELVMRAREGRLLLAGGRPRGTIYAVDRFLQAQCGVRWWTPWATNIPHRPTLSVAANLEVRSKPAFEYRAPYWFPGFDALWKTRNGANDEAGGIPAELGGCIRYKGFCHTFYPLVPPERYFAEHPDWYSLIKGQRTHNRAQLCLTNPQLRDFVVQRVKEWLHECPDCEIVSVTQNDWYGACECPDCKALDDAEGSHSGTMLAFANYIGEKIEAEFPKVAVDTFAYTYTRKPPKTLRSRPNVIVRLCSIECNFREPLDHPSNAEFAADIRKWAAICPRLYVWDYTTEFAHYIHPHPNWFTLGPNVRFFAANHVRGLFEQGAYAGQGAEMAELRAWVLAQLMWDPQQDDRKLIHEFLEGYYGKEAARPIADYLELLHDASKGFFLGCFLRKDPPPYLNFKTVDSAERLWQTAERAANPEQARRVRVAHLPLRYAILKDWKRLRLECWEQNQSWPLADSRQQVAAEFAAVCAGYPDLQWTQVRVMNERGVQVEDFVKQVNSEVNFDVDVKQPPPRRSKQASRPPDVSREVWRKAVDLQDDLAALFKRGEFADIRPDPAASDLRAVRMPGNYSEWAFRIKGDEIARRTPNGHGQWNLNVVVRVEKLPGAKEGANAPAFGAGVYDGQSKTYPAEAKFPLEQTSDSYKSYSIGLFEPSTNRDVFVCPLSNPCVKAIWVDRVYLTPAGGTKDGVRDGKP